MKGTHGRAVRRAGRIGTALLLWTVAASGQTAAAAEPPAAAPLAIVPHVEPLPAEAPLDSELDAALVPADAVFQPESEPAPAPADSLIEQAWRAPGAGFAERVVQTRRASLALGAWSLDPVARSLAAGDPAASPMERATAAVELAPDLPSAHMRFASALWLEGGSPMAAIRAVLGAFQAITRHPEASLWFAGCGSYLLAVALVTGGLIAMTLGGVAGVTHAAHDLGHLIHRTTPEFARCAALAVLLILPLALGEGPLGLALASMVVAAVYGGRAQRFALLLAIAAVGLGAHPMMRYAGMALSAFSEDPVAQAVASVAQGVAAPVELARLEAAAEDDTLAVRGLAIQARRTGDLAAADALYQRLLASGADDVAALNNAANVRFDLGDLKAALEIYERAAARQRSPVVLFNLAQAYGRAFQVEDLNRTIAEAQETGGDLISQLTALQGGDAAGFVVDLPLAPSLFWSRAFGSAAGSDLGAEFRARFAPGRLGREPVAFAVTAAALLLLGSALASRGRPSYSCQRCGHRVCSRCDRQNAVGELCGGCNQLYYEPEKTDRVLRVQRVNELQKRARRVARIHTAISLLVPGAAGLLAERPFRSWLGATCFALLVAALVWRTGVVPDPLVAGAAGPAAFLAVAAVSALGYVLAVWSSLAARRND